MTCCTRMSPGTNALRGDIFGAIATQDVVIADNACIPVM